MQDSVLDYLNDHGFNSGVIVQRFIQTLKMAHNFVNIKKIAQNINVDGKLLKIATIDFFVDIARVKEFHKEIKIINFEKNYGYMAYWILKRKPLQIIKEFPGSEFINELFVAAYIIPLILAEKGKNGSHCIHKSFEDFQILLFYNLKYRQLTQQSLELMINSFSCGCDFVPINTATQNNTQ